MGSKIKSWEEYKAECEAIAKEGITILGFVAPWGGSRTKLICNCEKHGEWLTTNINTFKKGVSCPGCGKGVTKLIPWQIQKEQCEIVAKKGITILGFIKPWRGAHTKLICQCDKHGEWRTGSITTFKGGVGCPGCGRDLARISNQRNDSIHISKFRSLGIFKEGTIFTRSDKLDKGGRKIYWYITCPVCSNDEYTQAGLCSGVFEAGISSLKKGNLPCRCASHPYYTKQQWEWRLDKACIERGYKFIKWKSKKFGVKEKFIYSCSLHGLQTTTANHFLQGCGCPECAGHSQQECYINLVYDEATPVTLKFGIANDSKLRLRRQNRSNLFNMREFLIYEFNNVENCKAAERACLQELECGILTARELKDGWTETTSIQNLDKIIEIYERFGGVRIK